MKAYRICERKGDNIQTLFHGVNGSRTIPMNEWLTAKIKLVTDGTRETSTQYMSGFHVFAHKEDCRKFIGRFKKERDLVMVECEVGGKMWKKSHSPAPIILAEKMKVLSIVEKLK
jgi:hypothetical protein